MCINTCEAPKSLNSFIGSLDSLVSSSRLLSYNRSFYFYTQHFILLRLFPIIRFLLRDAKHNKQRTKMKAHGMVVARDRYLDRSHRMSERECERLSSERWKFTSECFVGQLFYFLIVDFCVSLVAVQRLKNILFSGIISMSKRNDKSVNLSIVKANYIITF